LIIGTPHSGSGIARPGKVIANIISACSQSKPPVKLLETLEKDSEVLFDIAENFVHISPKLQLVSFYELEMTPIGPSKQMVRSSFCRVRSYGSCFQLQAMDEGSITASLGFAVILSAHIHKKQRPSMQKNSADRSRLLSIIQQFLNYPTKSRYPKMQTIEVLLGSSQPPIKIFGPFFYD
jgi:hypothetical protein